MQLVASFRSLLRSKLDPLANFQRGKSSASYSCRVSSPSSFTNTHVRFSCVCVRTKLAALSPLLRHETNALSANHRGPPSIRMMITMTITMTRWKMTRRSCQSTGATGKPRNLVSTRLRPLSLGSIEQTLVLYETKNTNTLSIRSSNKFVSFVFPLFRRFRLVSH